MVVEVLGALPPTTTNTTATPPVALTPVSPPQAAQMFKQRDGRDSLHGTVEG